MYVLPDKSSLVGLIKSFDQLGATQEARNKLIVVKINNETQQAPALLYGRRILRVHDMSDGNWLFSPEGFYL